MDIQNYTLKNGIKITHIKTDKFKTNAISLLIHNQLDKETASLNALLPMVLRRGSVEYPTMQDLSLELEKLYGSTMSVQTFKKGERQITQFYINFIDSQYINGEELFYKCANILNSVITNPLLENNMFKEEYVEQEKVNLINQIEMKLNDKVSYAVDRMYELMCDKEPFGVCELGDIDQIKNITTAQLTEHYKNYLKNSEITLIVLGNIDETKVKELGDILNLTSHDLSWKENNHIKVEKIREYTEEMEVNQAKLSFGIRANTDVNADDFYALMMYSCVLGGGTHSKLFQNVREKANLAYYAVARFEKYKGTISITSGIEMKNYEKAKKIILEQIDEMKKGNISESEMKDSIVTLKNGYVSAMDEPNQLLDYYIGQQMVKKPESVEDMISKLEKVTKQDIIKIAQKVEVDTMYLLKPNASNEERGE